MSKYRIRYDFVRYGPTGLTPSFLRKYGMFGPTNEGIVIEAETTEEALEKFIADRLPGQRINPWYLEIRRMP